ncbi:MAG: phosphotransferase [Acidobacteriota bacterium]
MEHESRPAPITINGELFDVVKPTRLLPGMVLKSKTRDVYARLGPKASALEEQIHTISLQERGFPVANVLDSGEYGNDEWYFIEQSLGEATFSQQFREEYLQDGKVSAPTHESYLKVLDTYAAAQFDPANRTHIAIEEFLEAAIPDSTIIANYLQLGGDIDRYHAAIKKAADELRECPMGVLQLDLNPFNILEGGVIDFELVGYGPIGYDLLFCSRWHRWFTSDTASQYHLNYLLSPEQVAEADAIVTRYAEKYGLPSPTKHMAAFTLIKSAWGFTSTKTFDEEPESKQAFYRYRARILTLCVDAYLKGEAIDPLTFPEVRA